MRLKKIHYMWLILYAILLTSIPIVTPKLCMIMPVFVMSFMYINNKYYSVYSM